MSTPVPLSSLARGETVTETTAYRAVASDGTVVEGVTTDTVETGHSHGWRGSWGWGYGFLWWLILAIVIFLILVWGRPSWVRQNNNDDCHNKCGEHKEKEHHDKCRSDCDNACVDYGKAFLAAIVISLLVLFVLWIFFASSWC